MNILILGGTRFLGPHLIDKALERGHGVTVFNRGRLSSEIDSRVTVITGDRHRDLDKLAGQRWDAVIDNCGYLPKSVEMSAQALKDSVDTYVFISSVSAYADFSQTGLDETNPLAELAPEQQQRADEIDLTGDITAPVLGEMYGSLKAACERAIEKEIPGRTLIIRPGLIVGPLDHTDRFTYWIMRVADGGEVLAPGEPLQNVQFIDVRDVSAFIVTAVGTGLTGAYQVDGLPHETTMGSMLDTIKRVTASDVRFTWVDEQFIEREGVQPWNELPVYLPTSFEDAAGFMSKNIDRALAAGLTLRSLDETVRDTFEWRASQKHPLRAGITRERENELLKKWHELSQ